MSSSPPSLSRPFRSLPPSHHPKLPRLFRSLLSHHHPTPTIPFTSPNAILRLFNSPSIAISPTLPSTYSTTLPTHSQPTTATTSMSNLLPNLPLLRLGLYGPVMTPSPTSAHGQSAYKHRMAGHNTTCGHRTLCRTTSGSG